MNRQKWLSEVIQDFAFEPTENQSQLFEKISEFVFDKEKNSIFIINGYAGTGKTTIIKTITNNLWKVKKKFVLMAPTGRAAKVMSKYSDKTTQTIHKYIYNLKQEKNGDSNFVLRENIYTNTIFIVDEASMISNQSIKSDNISGNSLLHDLMKFVYDNKNNCKVIFLGDTAQLPPVNSVNSPALDSDYISMEFDKTVYKSHLTQVIRQKNTSSILTNASIIRDYSDFDNNFKFEDLKNDIIRLDNSHDIESYLNDEMTKSESSSAVIVRSNKRAALYNQQIRSRIFSREDKIEVGDRLMVVRNNYFWIDKNSKAGFIANGDIIEVWAIYEYIELYGFEFAKIKVSMVDYPNQKAFDTIVITKVLDSHSPTLSYEDNNLIYKELIKDFADIKSGYAKYLKIKKNPYFNALQVKYSYAITCHKSQGGQWDSVFVEQPFVNDNYDRDYYRWLYTAITRCQNKLYLIGFKDKFFK